MTRAWRPCSRPGRASSDEYLETIRIEKMAGLYGPGEQRKSSRRAQRDDEAAELAAEAAGGHTSRIAEYDRR